jgi:O-antigen/teichoic acid export membrane protein
MAHDLSSSKVVGRNAVYNLIGYGVAAAYILVLLPIVVHYLGTERFGLWVLIMALTGYVGLVDLGLSLSFTKYVSQYISERRFDNVSSVFRHGIFFYLGISVLIIVLGGVLAPYVFDALSVPSEQLELAGRAFLVALFGFGVNAIVYVFLSLLSGIQRMDVVNIFTSVAFVVKFGAIVAALVLGLGLVGMMVAEVLVGLVSLVPAAVLVKRYLPEVAFWRFSIDRSMFKRLLKFGGQLQVSRFAELVQLQFDKLLISRYIGLTSVTMYDFGSRPLNRLRALPLTGLMGLLPAVSALDVEGNEARIRAGLLRSTRYLLVVAVPLFAFAAAFAHEIMHVWLGSGFSQAAQTLQILAAGYLVGIATGPLAVISQGRGEPQYQMKTTLVQALANIILSTTLVLIYGFYGAVAGTAIAAVVGALLFTRIYGRRIVEHPLRTIGGLLAKPLVAAVPAGVAALGTMSLLEHLLSPSTRPGILGCLILAFCVFSGGYAVMVYLLRLVGADDKRFLKEILPSRFSAKGEA